MQKRQKGLNEVESAQECKPYVVVVAGCLRTMSRGEGMGDRAMESGGGREKEKARVFEIPILGKYLAELFH